MSKTNLRKRLYIPKKHHEYPIQGTNGQVSLDFIAGTVIFMVTFFFLFQTLTGLFVPFQSNSDEIKSLADRAGMILAESTEGLADNPTETNIISLKRATALNRRLNTSYDYYDSDYSYVREKLGILSDTTFYNVNVSLRETDNTLYEYNNSVVLNNGPLPPENINVAQSIRVVYIKQTEDIAVLYVKVW